MKILFIRHGEPDYARDSLTPKGWKEADLLADRITKLDIRDFYCSPLGRAKDTARATLQRMEREAVIMDWLQEIPVRVIDPETGKRRVPWDFLPSYWTQHPALYNKDEWYLD
jgi:probable phosphoglycerate mutase